MGFFTKRERKPSLRLTLLARLMQGVALILLVAWPIALFAVFTNARFHDSYATAFTHPFGRIASSLLTIGAIFATSRGLLRREKWAVYVTGAAFSTPVLMTLLNRPLAVFNPWLLMELAIPLAWLASTWREFASPAAAWMTETERLAQLPGASSTDIEREIVSKTSISTLAGGAPAVSAPTSARTRDR